MHVREWRQRINESFNISEREREVMVYARLSFTKKMRKFVVKPSSGIEPTYTLLEWYVVGVGWMPTANKIVGENNGKEGKSPRLNVGYRRNSTHKYGNNSNKEEQHNNQWNLNSELKVKEERKVKESDIWEKRESRVYMAKLARITMNPFSSSKHTLCNLQKWLHNFINLFGNKVVWVGIKIFLVNILLWILFTQDYFYWNFYYFFVITRITFNMN